MNHNFARSVAMVRPAAFQYNCSTASTNHFQERDHRTVEEILKLALAEFDHMVDLLRSSGIDVLVLNDPSSPELPDAVFPNNWFVSLPGEIMICPMHSKSRREEKKPEHLQRLKEFTGSKLISDWSKFEAKGLFLEGTGSLVLDRENRKAFACRSERTTDILFNKFCKHAGYEGIFFDAYDRQGREIYHTNVMMCIGNHFAVICEEALRKPREKAEVTKAIAGCEKEVIGISFLQMQNFAGNMLQLQNTEGEPVLLMSSSARESLHPNQLQKIQAYTRILSVNIKTIETIGGGSARCMMAELF